MLLSLWTAYWGSGTPTPDPTEEGCYRITEDGAYRALENGADFRVVEVCNINPVQPPTLLGNGKKQGGYHSWTLHYENQLLLKAKREEEERLAKIEEAREEIEELEKLQVAPIAPQFIGPQRDYALEIAILLQLIQDNELLILEAQRIQRVKKNNMALLLLMMASPLSSFSIN